MIFLPPTSLALGLQPCVTRPGKSFCLLSSLEDGTKSNLPPSTLSPVPNTILESVLTKQGTGWARKKGPTQSNDESVSWKSWRTSQIPQNTLSADRGQKTVCDVGGVSGSSAPTRDSKHCLKFIWHLLFYLTVYLSKKWLLFPRSRVLKRVYLILELILAPIPTLTHNRMSHNRKHEIS